MPAGGRRAGAASRRTARAALRRRRATASSSSRSRTRRTSARCARSSSTAATSAQHATSRARDASSRSRPTAVGGLPRALQRLRHALRRAPARAVEIGPKTKALPVRAVTRDAGEYLHWSGDSKRLHWSLGPELFTRELKDAFAFLDGAPEKLPEPPASGRRTSASHGRATCRRARSRWSARASSPCSGDEVIEDGTVVVEGNRIAAVGPRDGDACPPARRSIDVAGKTVMPGLVDVHWHGADGHGRASSRSRTGCNYASLPSA